MRHATHTSTMLTALLAAGALVAGAPAQARSTHSRKARCGASKGHHRRGSLRCHRAGRHRHPLATQSRVQDPFSPQDGCTWWVDLKRPDVYQRTQQVAPASDWNAEAWGRNARAGGFRVDGTPAVGAIAVWQPGQETRFDHGAFLAGDVGHVAYVIGLGPHGTFAMSASGTAITHPGEYQVFRGVSRAGLQFIH